MTTARDIINLALKSAGVVGVGQSALAEDVNDALKVLNMMMGQWAAKRWLVYHLRDVAKVSTGAQSYTVGAGGDFNIARPDRIEAAFVRLNASSPNPVDYTLSVVEAREDYNRIRVKSLGTLPTCVFYDSDYPLARVYFWPVPQASIYELHLTLREPISQFASLDQTINLPGEYEEALHYNLAGRLRPLFGLEADGTTSALAQAALNTIRTANTQVPRLILPAELTRGGAYNIFSDTGA